MLPVVILGHSINYRIHLEVCFLLPLIYNFSLPFLFYFSFVYLNVHTNPAIPPLGHQCKEALIYYRCDNPFSGTIGGLSLVPLITF